MRMACACQGRGDHCGPECESPLGGSIAFIPRPRAGAVDIEDGSGSTLPRWRALETAEFGQLFKTCLDESSPAGRREAAMVVILYGTGLRRAELAGLEVADLDLPGHSILVRKGKRRKQRTVYLSAEGSRLVEPGCR